MTSSARQRRQLTDEQRAAKILLQRQQRAAASIRATANGTRKRVSVDWGSFLVNLSEIGFIGPAAKSSGISARSVQLRKKRDEAFRRLCDRLAAPVKYATTPEATWEVFFTKLAEGMLPTHICALQGMPARSTFGRKMQEDPAFRERVRQYTRGYEDGIRIDHLVERIAAKQWDRLHQRVAEGVSAKAACREPGMPHYSTYMNYRRRDPAFAARFDALPKPRRTGISRIASTEARNSRLLQNELYSAAWAAVPAGLPQHVRDDVISEIVLAVLMEEIRLDQIKASAPKFMAQHYKMHPAKFGPISLDAPAFRDGGRDTIGDTISEGMWQ